MTTKQRLFIEHYLSNGFNATEAAKSAGYSKKTAYSIGQENLKKPEIKAEIERSIKDRLSRVDEEGLSVLQLIKHAAFFDLRRVMRWDDDGVHFINSEDLDDMDAIMISEISETVTKDGGTRRVRSVKKEQAWEMLAKFARLIDAPDRVGETQEERLSREEREERIAQLLKRRERGAN